MSRTTRQTDTVDIEQTAADLVDSFETLSAQMDELSESMATVADSFAAFGESTDRTFAAADD